MIIVCPCCEKKFEVDGNLIPEKGRTLQCGFCDQKWFFKKSYKEEIIEKPLQVNEYNDEKEEEITINDEVTFAEDDKNIQIKDKYYAKKLNFSLSKTLNYFIVLIITAIALIIFLDTFKYNLISIFPNLELFLYNLYETIKDIKLFINDLIK